LALGNAACFAFEQSMAAGAIFFFVAAPIFYKLMAMPLLIKNGIKLYPRASKNFLLVMF
jgi:hypothetical protein